MVTFGTRIPTQGRECSIGKKGVESKTWNVGDEAAKILMIDKRHKGRRLPGRAPGFLRGPGQGLGETDRVIRGTFTSSELP